MTDDITVICGMNNPLSDDPRHALAPYPANCAGWRLWQMLNAVRLTSRTEYMRAFDRRNVLHARAWSRTQAREAGADLWRTLGGRRVVLLGVATLAAVGAPRTPWGVWVHPPRSLTSGPEAYCLLPHPSGRCLEYNDPTMRATAGAVLLTEFARHAPQEGDTRES